jgi:pimeloyl-ACP methyl ester carboxylesterase
VPDAHVNGIRLHYEIQGDGPPLVLIHGFSGTGCAWNDWLPKLADRYRVVVPDLRAHGRSTGAPETIHHAQFAEDLVALLDHLGIDRAHFVGHSSGGMALLFVGTRFASRVRTLTLVSATLHFDQHARRRMVESCSDAAWDQTRIAAVQQRHGETHGPDHWRVLRAAFLEFSRDANELPFLPDDLRPITCPVLVLHGDRDEFFPIHIPVTLYQALPNAELCILPATDHHPPVERPAWFNAITLDFLERRLRSAGGVQPDQGQDRPLYRDRMT